MVECLSCPFTCVKSKHLQLTCNSWKFLQFFRSSLALTLRKLPICNFFPQMTQLFFDKEQFFQGTTQNLSRRGPPCFIIWYAASVHTSGYTQKNTPSRARADRMPICCAIHHLNNWGLVGSDLFGRKYFIW